MCLMNLCETCSFYRPFLATGMYRQEGHSGVFLSSTEGQGETGNPVSYRWVSLFLPLRDIPPI